MYVHEFVHPSASWRPEEGVRPLGGGVTVAVSGAGDGVGGRCVGTKFRSYAGAVLVPSSTSLS